MPLRRGNYSAVHLQCFNSLLISLLLAICSGLNITPKRTRSGQYIWIWMAVWHVQQNCAVSEAQRPSIMCQKLSRKWTCQTFLNHPLLASQLFTCRVLAGDLYFYTGTASLFLYRLPVITQLARNINAAIQIPQCNLCLQRCTFELFIRFFLSLLPAAKMKRPLVLDGGCWMEKKLQFITCITSCFFVANTQAN